MNLPDLAIIAIIVFIITGTIFVSYKLSCLRKNMKKATKEMNQMTKELKRAR